MESHFTLLSPTQETRAMDINLRKICRDDLDYFYVWASDPEVAKTTTWEAYTSLFEAERFLIEVAEKHPWFKAILVDRIPVGAITLKPGNGSTAKRAELGYVLSKAFWGKGIATAAIKLALESGFQVLGVSRIEAFVDPDNIASQKALLKAGMTCEGLLKSYTFFKGAIKDRIIYAKTDKL